MVPRHVHVFPLTLVLLRAAGPNVQSIPSVEATRPVLERNVRILAPDFAEYRPNVLYWITYRLVLVWMVIRVMHSPAVNWFRLVSRLSLTEWLAHYISHKTDFYTEREPIEEDPCNPSPCGSNAQCNNGVCTCLPEYHGDPYFGCRPECVLNSDCSRDKACLRSKCVNPCTVEVCAQNAICEVVSHIPMCRCPSGFEGNALVQCQPMRSMHISFTLNSTFEPFYQWTDDF